MTEETENIDDTVEEIMSALGSANPVRYVSIVHDGVGSIIIQGPENNTRDMIKDGVAALQALAQVTPPNPFLFGDDDENVSYI